MSQEIVDAVRILGREKGISEEKLMTALEDALLSAYKKTPDAAKFARVEMDREMGDFLVWEVVIPVEIEDDVVVEIPDEEFGIDPETGELLTATDTEVTVAADTGVVSIAYADIHRSNLLGD